MTSCSYCGAPSGAMHAPGCAAMRVSEEPIRPAGGPYGVPTGVVPRVQVNIALPKAYTPARAGDPVAQAVDDYLLMERKARAWDKLRERAVKAQWQTLLVQMDALVHPAQDSSTSPLFSG